MSVQSVRDFFAKRELDIPVIETEELTATVEQAALRYAVEPGRIAKTLAFRLSDGRVVLLVACGNARIDNKMFRAAFGRSKMLPVEELVRLTGHPVGGVCPFGLASPLPVYMDRLLQGFDEVIPAAGSPHSAVRISPALMAEVTGARWVEVCKV